MRIIDKQVIVTILDSTLGYAKTKLDLHGQNSSTQGGWAGVNAGIRGLTYCYPLTKRQAPAEIFIEVVKNPRKKMK